MLLNILYREIIHIELSKLKGMVKDSVEILNNMYNKSNEIWTDRLYIKSFKKSDRDKITEIEITECRSSIACKTIGTNLIFNIITN